MATIVMPPITLDQLPESLRNVARTFSPVPLKRGFMLPMSKKMERETREQFSRGKDPRGRLWKSTAPRTKYNGRFSVNYNIRPSGAPVRASSVRLRDTGELMNSIHSTKVTAKNIVVEPVGDRNVEIALQKA
ncbi:MAG: hypothetical protein KAU20_01210, partial [Nanoarchaeota archaeon]|nr:hypothetical protein [Nanoarchaeota archaeon]